MSVMHRLASFIILGLLSSFLSSLPALAFETRARAAWVYDVTTHTVLMDKNGKEPLPPASMSKLMTVNMLFEALKDGRVTLDTEFAVSKNAMAIAAGGGSTMYLQESDRPTVKELIQGMIINSGNDACVVVAEGLEGSEAEFAAKMMERAAALGLENSHFVNATGWPDPGQRMSMRDLGLLASRLIEQFPDLYPVFSETEFNYKDRAPANANNRNLLLKLNIGADGLKTGHTEEAGYGIVGSVKRGERRIIFAISGLASDTERAEEAERIADWAFTQFVLKTVVKAGTEVAQAQVSGGSAPGVGLVVEQAVRLLLPANNQNLTSFDVIHPWPITAPVSKGKRLGELVIRMPNLPEHRIPLVAGYDVTAIQKLDSD